MLQEVPQEGNVLNIFCEGFDFLICLLNLILLRAKRWYHHIGVENLAPLIDLGQQCLLLILVSSVSSRNTSIDLLLLH